MGLLTGPTPLGRAQKKKRALVKRGLKEGRVSLRWVLTERPECCWEMPVYELVRALPGVGPARMAVLNDDAMKARVNLFLPVLALGPRERAWLVTRLKHHEIAC